MKVSSSLSDEVQRQATTEVVLGEVRRLRTQGEMMVRSLDMVESTIRLAVGQGYACESQGEVLEALGREGAVSWGAHVEAAGTMLRESVVEHDAACARINETSRDAYKRAREEPRPPVHSLMRESA